jgi:hypothetical protein
VKKKVKSTAIHPCPKGVDRVFLPLKFYNSALLGFEFLHEIKKIKTTKNKNKVFFIVSPP